jgi:hypothetical protein
MLQHCAGFLPGQSAQINHMKTNNSFKQEVTRTEIFEVSDGDLNRERTFQKGKQDRIARLPCCSANGAYLNGWYNPEVECYYIPKAALHLL